MPGVTGERHLLGDRELVDVVAGLGGTPSAVLDSPDLAHLFLPCLRADFTLVETYRPHGDPAADGPADRADRRRGPGGQPGADGALGRAHDRGFGLHVFPGDHFYLKGLPEALRRTLLDAARRVTARPATPGWS